MSVCKKTDVVRIAVLNLIPGNRIGNKSDFVCRDHKFIPEPFSGFRDLNSDFSVGSQGAEYDLLHDSFLSV